MPYRLKVRTASNVQAKTRQCGRHHSPSGRPDWKGQISNVLYYFKAQRCSGLLDKADRHLTFAGNSSGRIVDAHGGWFDATGDYGKHLSHLCFSTYFNPQQIPLVVWSLFKSYEALRHKQNRHYGAIFAAGAR